MPLIEIEQDFIDFISQKNKLSATESEKLFILTKEQFAFSGSEYRKLSGQIHDLFRIIYHDQDEKTLVEAYQFHALMHLFRFISYSYPAAKPRYSGYLKSFVRALSKGEFNKIFNFIQRKTTSQSAGNELRNPQSRAKFLIEQLNAPQTATVVDYGCGLGYISFEIGKLDPQTKIYLVDIDCLTLEFAEFRFKKHGLNVETIKIIPDDIYPTLPKHNICLATEVMEHVVQPLTVYKNILGGLEKGGLLYGNFADHSPEMFHVSPDLSELRHSIASDFQPIGKMCYKKL